MADESSKPEVIAERTEGAAAASGFGVDARSIIDAWGNILEEAAVQPRAVLDASRNLIGDLGRIWLGTSDMAPDASDTRFHDDAWRGADNSRGVYRRWRKQQGIPTPWRPRSRQ